jgi:hypothetical protein
MPMTTVPAVVVDQGRGVIRITEKARIAGRVTARDHIVGETRSLVLELVGLWEMRFFQDCVLIYTNFSRQETNLLTGELYWEQPSAAWEGTSTLKEKTSESDENHGATAILDIETVLL